MPRRSYIGSARHSWRGATPGGEWRKFAREDARAWSKRRKAMRQARDRGEHFRIRALMATAKHHPSMFAFIAEDGTLLTYSMVVGAGEPFELPPRVKENTQAKLEALSDPEVIAEAERQLDGERERTSASTASGSPVIGGESRRGRACSREPPSRVFDTIRITTKQPASTSIEESHTIRCRKSEKTIPWNRNDHQQSAVAR